jgi:hypothetical protein
VDFEAGRGDFGGVAKAVCVGVVAVKVLGDGVGGWELGVFAVFVHEDYAAVVEEGYKGVF